MYRYDVELKSSELVATFIVGPTFCSPLSVAGDLGAGQSVPPLNITCVVYNWSSMTCSWPAKYTNLSLHYAAYLNCCL